MMKVKDLMEKEVVTVRMESTFRELFILIFNYHITDFPVVDTNHHLKGMVYERDLLLALYPPYVSFTDNFPDISDLQELAMSVQDLQLERITTTKVLSVGPEDNLMKAGSAMLVEKVSTVPVVSNGVVVGTVKQNQIFSSIMRLAESEQFEINQSSHHPENKAPGVDYTPNDPVTEKRLYKRVKVNMTVAYKLTSLNAPETVASRGHLASAINISTGGLLLRTELPLPVNTLLNLAFDLSGKNQPIKRIGRVTRCVPSKDPGFYEVGIMFLAMSTEEIKQIDSYLTRLG